MKSKLSYRTQNINPTQLWDGYKKYVLQNKSEYNSNPNICLNVDCQTIIPYEKKKNKFCSKSCAGKHNGSTKNKDIKPGPKKTKFECSKVTFKRCELCNKAFRFKVGNRSKHCSDTCYHNSITNINAYRKECKFYINKKDHPTLFDSDLISKYGWYSPTNLLNNINGVSWDHLYRISDGFKNNISPSILSHPANAELVPHPVNQRRRVSTISLNELMHRIQLWENGITTLKKYYFE